MVDTEKLISLVYERKPLWEIQSKNYHNGLSFRAFIVCIDNTYQFSAVCENSFPTVLIHEQVLVSIRSTQSS